jgi:hypothetical protein
VAYLIIVLILVVFITLVIIVIEIVLILEVVLVEVIEALLKLQCLTREPIDGTRDELLLDVLTELVVELELLLDLLVYLIILVRRRRCWVEEVEEGRGRDGLLDDAGLLGVCGTSQQPDTTNRGRNDLLLFLCFLLSILTVRSLPAFQSILSPSAWS